MNQRLKAELREHDTPVLQLALLALTATKSKLEAGMTDDEQRHTICTYVSHYINKEGHGPYHREIKILLRKTAKTWADFSGNPTCPVPAPIDFLTGESNLLPEEKIYERVFHGHLYEGNFWDQATEYGRMRADLLNHHIEVVSKELSSRNVTQTT